MVAPLGRIRQGRANGRRRREIETSSQPKNQRLSAIFRLEIDAQFVMCHLAGRLSRP
jgi:hypothetical protein